MALWVCLDCTTAYAVGLFRCPRCHGTKFAEEGTEEAEMAKITVQGGPSNAAEQPAGEEEVPSSPGTSSATSTTKPSPKPSKSERQNRPRAQTTASPSKQAQTGSSSAPSTAGGQTAATSATASAESAKDDKK